MNDISSPVFTFLFIAVQAFEGITALVIEQKVITEMTGADRAAGAGDASVQAETRAPPVVVAAAVAASDPYVPADGINGREVVHRMRDAFRTCERLTGMAGGQIPVPAFLSACGTTVNLYGECRRTQPTHITRLVGRLAGGGWPGSTSDAPTGPHCSSIPALMRRVLDMQSIYSLPAASSVDYWAALPPAKLGALRQSPTTDH